MSGLNNNEFRLHQFSVEVCDIIRQIPAGKVLTYGQIARLPPKESLFNRMVVSI